ITYALGLFAAEREDLAALGHWVHVYIDRVSRSPVPVPAAVRELLVRAEEARVGGSCPPPRPRPHEYSDGLVEMDGTVRCQFFSRWAAATSSCRGSASGR